MYGVLYIDLSIKYIMHLLVIRCKYLRNAPYAQVQDSETIINLTWL